jgi:ATP-binding cassette subfamily B protein
MAQDSLTLASLGAALFVYSPWLLLLLVAAVLPSFLGETHYASLEYSLLYRWTPERRHLDYLRYLGASDETAKEVQMFGLAGWLTNRYRTLADRYYEENKRLSVRKAIVSTLLSVLGMLGYYAAYVIILLRAVQGVISIGTLTFLSASFSRSRDIIQRVLITASDVYESSLYLKDLFDFFDKQPSITSRPGARRHPRRLRLRRRGLPLSGERALGRAAREFHPASARAHGVRGRERGGEDDAHQAAGPPVRSHRGADPAGRRGSARL